MSSGVEIVKTKPNVQKIVESILAAVRFGVASGAMVTQYDIVKTIFLADKTHLNKYGRPITFDRYVAMYHGPVPSCTYDFLKEKADAQRAYGAPFPWKRDRVNANTFSYHSPQREVDENRLSPSDIEELEAAFKLVKSLGFKQVRKLTHDDPAYIEAWRDEGGPNAAYPMAYGLLFEQPDFARAKEVAFFSEHA